MRLNWILAGRRLFYADSRLARLPVYLASPRFRQASLPARRRFVLTIVAAGFACSTAVAEAAPARPLLPRSQSDHPTLFESLPASSTGVTAVNSFDDPRCWGELYRAFNNGSLGTGVAIADYDGDGRPDVAVTAKTGSVTLYRNLGDLRFEDVTQKAGLAPEESGGSGVLGWLKSAVGSESKAAQPWSHGVVFADVDNNGWLDLYVCRFNAPNLLYMNRGDGTFAEEAGARGLAISDASVVAAFCDYDRDGWLDVYLQTNLLDERSGPDGQRDYLLRNQGAGVFVDVSANLRPRVPSQGHSCAWWDFDDDGWPDLYVANDFAVPDMLYRNQGDGTFADVAGEALPYTPFSSMGSDTGDVDGDGLTDFFVADMAATSHEKDQRTMAVARYLAPAPKPGEAPQLSRNMLFLGTGTGRVREAAYLTGMDASDWTWSPRFEDFDCDGRIDLLITNGMNREHHNVDLHERSNRLASPEERMAVFRNSPVLHERNLAFRNDGNLRFTEVGGPWGFDELGVSFGSATGDLDGDGDLDLVAARYDQTPAIYRNTGSAGERVVIRLKGIRSNRFGIGAKVRLETSSGWQLREIWTARGYQSSSEPAAFFGFAAGEQLQQVRVEWPDGSAESWGPLAAGSTYELVQGTGKPGDTSFQRPTPVFERVESGASPVAFAAAAKAAAAGAPAKSPRLQPRQLSRLGPGMAVVDLDRDGREEILLGGGARTEMTRVGSDLGASSLPGLSRGATGAGAALDDGPMFVFDADTDGHEDILTSRTGEVSGARPPDYALRLWLANGQGGFAPAPPGMIPDQPISAGAIAGADFDRDGTLEVFVGSRVLPGQYPRGGDSMLLRARAGTWTDACGEIAPALVNAGMVTAALWSDVDDDGWLDLVIACEWGRVRCFFNTRDGRLEERPEQDPFARAGRGWWNSLAAADFNRDGRIDYLAGNAGLNTHYRASAAEPALLLQLPTGRSRTATALLEAYHEGGKRFPWRTRRDLGTAWPSITRKFPTNDSFAQATIEEIFGSEVIAGAETWAAEELRSGVFLSRPDGSFDFLPLPDICQIAPVHGILAGDLDGDGLADACLLQNNTGQVSGSWNGGLGQFLRGRGDGAFDPVGPRDSGFVVPGEGRGIGAFDPAGTGEPVVFVARNQEPPLLFRTAPHERVGTFAALRLRQPGSNPRALGARIALTWTDGRVSTAEVSSASGYMTHPSGTIYAGLEGQARPTHATVRWPDGVEIQYPLSGRSGLIIIDRVQGVSRAD